MNYASYTPNPYRPNVPMPPVGRRYMPPSVGKDPAGDPRGGGNPADGRRGYDPSPTPVKPPPTYDPYRTPVGGFPAPMPPKYGPPSTPTYNQPGPPLGGTNGPRPGNPGVYNPNPPSYGNPGRMPPIVHPPDPGGYRRAMPPMGGGGYGGNVGSYTMPELGGIKPPRPLIGNDNDVIDPVAPPTYRY